MHPLVGTGPSRVILLHDWLSDTSSWDAVLPILACAPATWARLDLRGYGVARGTMGEYSARQAAADVLALADALGWSHFAVVGHSMSTLVAVHLAQTARDRVTKAVVVGPPPARGIGYDDATLAAVREVALGDDERRTRFARVILGERLGDAWLRYKVERWRATSDPDAVAAYARMFGRDGVPEPETRLGCPVLAITGAEDAPVMRRDAALAWLAPMGDDVRAVELADCGHYPMQEAPARLAAELARFVG